MNKKAYERVLQADAKHLIEHVIGEEAFKFMRMLAVRSGGEVDWRAKPINTLNITRPLDPEDLTLPASVDGNIKMDTEQVDAIREAFNHHANA